MRCGSMVVGLTTLLACGQPRSADLDAAETTGNEDANDELEAGSSSDGGVPQAPDPAARRPSDVAAPLALDDDLVAVAGQPLLLSGADGVLANDVRADRLSQVGEAQHSDASVEWFDDGRVHYVPTPDYGGCDVLAYRAAGAGGDSDWARAAIFVEHPQVGPAAVSLRGGPAAHNQTLLGDVGDAAGASVAMLGDFDGDSRPETAIGAPQSSMGAGASGRVFIRRGGSGPDEPGWVLDGMGTGSDAGAVVAPAGDVNGDGLADLIVGAPHTNLGGGPMGDYAGRAFVVFGRTEPGLVDLAEVHAGHGGFSVTGAMMADFVGAAAVGVGDWSNDGFGDVVIGVPRLDNAGQDAGAVAVVWGKADGDAVDFAPLGAAGRWVFGAQAGDRAGESLVRIGDLNDDGFDELLVGAPRASREHPEQGVAYVLYGPIADHVGLQHVAQGQGGFAIAGTSAYQRLGAVAAAVGDVDGDGQPDFALGDPDWDHGRGRVFVITDASAGIGLDAVVGGDAGLVIEGEAGTGRAGFALAPAGDVNADGRDDLWVAAPWAEGSDVAAGRIYLVYGRDDGQPIALGDVAAGLGGRAYDGFAEHDQTGRSLAGGADLDGDGQLDVVVGMPGAGGPGSASGGAVLVSALSRVCPD